MAEESLENLLEAVALKDRAAFETLYRASSAKLFGVCLRILHDRAEAEEALQETYGKIWRKADLYAKARATPIPWLSAIARNAAIDRLRARKPESAGLDMAEAFPDDRPTPEAATIAASENMRLQGCIDELPAQHGQAIRAAFFGGQTYEALAARANVPLGTMKSWVRRSLVKLKDCMQK